MVRKLIAALVEIGRGNMKEADFAAMVRGPHDIRFEPTAPPSGLFLEAIRYEGEAFDRALIPIVPVEARR
jgi:tRNA U38,U39,U40 pseudouridine synthase TruA